jgi:hypothetical protein
MRIQKPAISIQSYTLVGRTQDHDQVLIALLASILDPPHGGCLSPSHGARNEVRGCPAGNCMNVVPFTVDRG